MWSNRASSSRSTTPTSSGGSRRPPTPSSNTRSTSPSPRSAGCEKSPRVLAHMRGEYVDVMKRFSQGEVYHLERSIDEHSQQELLRVKQDELLELYSAWRSDPSASVEDDLERVVGEIRQI